MSNGIPIYKPNFEDHRRIVKIGKDYKQLLKEAAKKNPKLYRSYLLPSEHEEEII